MAISSQGFDYSRDSMFFETLLDYGYVFTKEIIPWPEITLGTLNVTNGSCFANLDESVAV